MPIKRTYNHPATGVLLTLDPAEVFPDDPGAGTPAMVAWRGHHGTYWCAVGEGEVDGLPLPKNALEWLNSARIAKLVDALGA